MKTNFVVLEPFAPFGDGLVNLIKMSGEGAEARRVDDFSDLQGILKGGRCDALIVPHYSGSQAPSAAQIRRAEYDPTTAIVEIGDTITGTSGLYNYHNYRYLRNPGKLLQTAMDVVLLKQLSNLKDPNQPISFEGRVSLVAANSKSTIGYLLEDILAHSGEMVVGILPPDRYSARYSITPKDENDGCGFRFNLELIPPWTLAQDHIKVYSTLKSGKSVWTELRICQK